MRLSPYPGETMHWTITPPDSARLSSIIRRIDDKTKPPGALGQLEALARQMALVQGQEKIGVARPVLLIFAADHGIAVEGVSIAGSEVTRQMVLNFLAGGAAANCFCRTFDVRLEVVDAGLLEPLRPCPEGLVEQRVGAGSAHFARQPAMSEAQARQSLEWGAERARLHVRQGADLLIAGEMGIGNTSAAAAMMAALLGLPAGDCVGRGTGISDHQFARKRALIETALQRVGGNDPLTVLRELGGFEIGQMAGALLGAAECGVLAVVDGFIASVAALLATRLHPACRHYLVFAHQSDEQGHGRLLAALDARPLLHLGMRLGEGSGGVLAVPLLRAAASFYNDMATFASAGVTV